VGPHHLLRGRGEDGASAPRRGRARDAGLRARARPRPAARASEPRPLPPVEPRGASLHGPRVRHRADPGRSPLRRGRGERPGDRAARCAHVLGAPLPALERRHPPRREAREPHHGRPAAPPRPRHRAHRGAPAASAQPRGNDFVHGPRAVLARADLARDGPVRAGRHAVRGPLGDAPVRRGRCRRRGARSALSAARRRARPAPRREGGPRPPPPAGDGLPGARSLATAGGCGHGRARARAGPRGGGAQPPRKARTLLRSRRLCR